MCPEKQATFGIHVNIHTAAVVIIFRNRAVAFTSWLGVSTMVDESFHLYSGNFPFEGLRVAFQIKYRIGPRIINTRYQVCYYYLRIRTQCSLVRGTLYHIYVYMGLAFDFLNWCCRVRTACTHRIFLVAAAATDESTTSSAYSRPTTWMR